MTGLADTALWIAIALAGINAGALAARRSEPGAPLRNGLLLMAAAAGVVAWSAVAGELLSGQTDGMGLLVPLEATAMRRLAALWSTGSGAALSLGAFLLCVAALGTAPVRRTTFALVLASGGLFALLWSAWSEPATPSGMASVPPFLQTTAAALASGGALGAVAALAWWIAAVFATGNRDGHLTLLGSAWVAATVSIGAEQVARSQVGLGPDDAIVLGSALSGLVLWLALSALLHVRIRHAGARAPAATSSGRAHRAIAHTGAACVIIGFALHIVAARSSLSLPPGERVAVDDVWRRSWTFVNQGVSRFDADGAEITSVAVEARREGAPPTLLAPEAREYHTRDGAHFETPVLVRRTSRGVVQDVRVLFTGADSADVAMVRVTFIPVPVLWHLGITLLVLAFVLMAAARTRRSTPT